MENCSYSCPVMIFHISVSLEEVCVVGESEEQCAYLRELHLYMPKLYILFILRKFGDFIVFSLRYWVDRRKTMVKMVANISLVQPFLNLVVDISLFCV